MASTFTPNIGLEEPARGDQVGTWDTPVNANMTLVDLTLGGTTVIPLTNANVVLSAAQYKCKTIVFTGALIGNVVITFPNTFLKSYEIFNTCTGNFLVQLTNGGSNVVAAPPGECTEVMNLNGGGFVGMYFKNLGRIGTYTDFGCASIPLWMQGCTVAPYLNCDGSAFNTTTYPILAILLGGGTLPDLRGRVRAYMNGGTGRLTGVIADTLLAGGGDSRLQSHTHGYSGTTGLENQAHNHNYNTPDGSASSTGGGAFGFFTGQVHTVVTGNENQNHNHSYSGNTDTGAGLAGVAQNVQPTTMAGLCMIRAG